MKATGASVKLATVVDGEALLNDGVAFVLFELIFEWAAGAPPSAGAAAAFVAKAALGGPALGLAWALALTAWWTLAYDDAVAEITISLVAAYSLWLVADELAGASGVLALVACGLALAAHGLARVSRSVAASFDAIWGWVDASANTLVFFISGLITSVEVIRR
jgi:NhaP-type Na+/H+ or K+/H+ antiporter